MFQKVENQFTACREQPQPQKQKQKQTLNKMKVSHKSTVKDECQFKMDQRIKCIDNIRVVFRTRYVHTHVYT